MGKYLDIARKFEARRAEGGISAQRPATPAVQPPSPTAGPPPASRSTRDFLSCPLEQENNPDPWDAWGDLFDWLREHHPDRFFAVCEAEEAIRTLERQGITEGQEYEQACQELLRRFEAARRLKMKEGFKVWVQ